MGAIPLELQINHPLPAAYRGPRGALLVALKRAGNLTARNLAATLGLSLNAVRHHLKELAAEGVVDYRREQRGVGAPTFAYHLSPAGEELFPQRYAEVLTEVLERMASASGRGAVVSALETHFADLAEKLRDELTDASPSRRRQIVGQALVDGGFMAEWTEAGGNFKLTEHHCALRAVAERFPEICESETKFLQKVLAAQVERETHILRGCTACEYNVRFPDEKALPGQLTRGSESREEQA